MIGLNDSGGAKFRKEFALLVGYADIFLLKKCSRQVV
jgi:acetyl-CoA carboxylase carboxyltransferase component